MTASNNGSYSEICLIGVTPKGSSEIQFAAKIDLDGFSYMQGTKDISTSPLANGGRIVKRVPQEDSEVTLKLYEIEIGTSDSLVQHFNGTSDATAPLTSTNTHIRNLFRVAFLWTDDTSVTTAGGSTTSGFYSLREVFTDVRMTECKSGVEEGTKILNVTFKGPAFTQAAAGRHTTESVKAADGSGLSALSSYS